MTFLGMQTLYEVNSTRCERTPLVTCVYLTMCAAHIMFLMLRPRPSQVMDAFGHVNGQLERGDSRACAYASDTARLDLEGSAVNGSFTCGRSSPYGLIIKKNPVWVLLAVLLPLGAMSLLCLVVFLHRLCSHQDARGALPAACALPVEQLRVRTPPQANVQVDESVMATQTHDPAWSDHVKVDARPANTTRGSELPSGAARVVLAEAICNASSTEPTINMPYPFLDMRTSRCSSDRSSRASSSRGSFGLRSSAQQRAAHLFSRVSELASEASPGRRISMRYARRASQAQVEAAQVRESATEIESGRSSRFSGLSARASKSRVSQPAVGGSASSEQPTARPRRGSARVLHMDFSPGSPRSLAHHNFQVRATAEASSTAEESPALVHSGAGSFEAAVREPRRAHDLNTTSL